MWLSSDFVARQVSETRRLIQEDMAFLGSKTKGGAVGYAASVTVRETGTKKIGGLKSPALKTELDLR